MTRIGIIGGGPAGTTLALHLIERGVAPSDLTIIDQATFPRPKLCGGGLTNRGTQLLEEILPDAGWPEGGGETMRLEFRAALGQVDVRETGGQWLYDRGLLDDRLLRACKTAGVRVIEGCRVRDIQGGPGAFKVEHKGGSEAFDWIAGADGARGVTRRAAGLGDQGGIVGRLVEAVYEPTGPNNPHRADTLYFDFDPILDGIPGYAWVFPYPKPGTPEGLYKLGIMDGRGVTKGAQLREWTDAFAERAGFRRVDDKLAGWPEHYWSPRTKAHVPGLILVGEAWGIDPLLGEGIAPAIELSRYAAKRLKGALDRGKMSIAGYERRYQYLTREGRNMWFQAKLADMLYGPNPYRWMRVLFENESLIELAASGNEQYGRLARRLPTLMLSYLWQVMRRGLPRNTPLLPAHREPEP